MMTIDENSTGFARARSTITAIFEYFLPEDDNRGAREDHRMRMFLVSHLLGPVLGGSVPIALAALDPTPGVELYILAAGIFAFWAFPPFLKMNVSYRLLVHLSVVNLNFVILWSCYHYGGASSPTLVWVLVVPLLALFYVGADRRLGTEVLLTALGLVTVFLAVLRSYPPVPQDIPETAIQALGLVSIFAAALYVSMMAIYYARMFASGVMLEEEVEARLARTREARVAIAQLDRAGTARAAFLASMSHELRTPLNAVIGYSQVLREDAEDTDDCEVLDDLDRIHTAGQYLLRTINGILDLAKLEAGRMEINATPTSLARIVQAATDERRDMFAAAGVSVRVDTDAAADVHMLDVEKVDRVVGTLLDNVITHAHATAATISVRATDDACILRVNDNGEGVTPVDRERIFDGFGTQSEATDNQYGGTGLSLAVARGLCEMMQGSLVLEAKKEAGCIFVMTLPLLAAPPSVERTTVTAPPLVDSAVFGNTDAARRAPDAVEPAAA